MNDKRVLVAEDSPTQAAVLRTHLERADFQVSVASNGAEAIELMEAEPYDLVVSDVVMPDVDGYQLCGRVKELHPSVPVVLLTSMTDPLDVVNALSAGADNFLRKPYEPTELIHRITNMLHNKQLRDSGRAQMGLELFFLGRRFMINSDREQILDLLVSTFEELVAVNQRLSAREEDLAAARDELAVRLEESERERERLDAVLAAVPGGMAVFDRDGRVIHANRALAELSGVPLPELNGSLVWDLIQFVDHHGTRLPPHVRGLGETLATGRGTARGGAFDLFLERKDGQRVPVVARSEPVKAPGGECVGAVGTLEDLRVVMDHDPVTGLPGHRVLLERLSTTADLTAEHGSRTAVVVVIIDRFDRFRERLPAAGVDEVIAGHAARLCDALASPEVAQRAPKASAAHLGNGELAVLLPDLDAEHDAVAVAQILVDRLGVRVEAEGLELSLTTSAAVALCDVADCDPATLLAGVTASARDTSRDGGGRVAVSEDRHEAVIEGLRREAELRRALEAGELVVHYQPQLRLRDEVPVGVEALVRWQHPDRGLLGAGEIVPLAVECGLIADLGWFVLEIACREGAARQAALAAGAAPVLSVNLAVEQLADPLVAERIADVLTSTGFHPTDLVLEITEGTVMHDPDLARDRLSQIKSLGCRIAIDDFGTGYSSLLQLRRLPVDILKIDRSFVDGMLDHPADAAIVATVVRLARALGLEVLAEGVEDLDQLVQLRVLGCDLGQGYHWAAAMPDMDLARWMDRHAASAVTSSTPSEALAETDERQDEVISYLVHELRSPLTAISGFTHLLRTADVADSAPEFLDAIARNAQELDNRLGSLREVNDLLRGGLTLRVQEYDVSDLVATLVEDLTPQLEPHTVTFDGDDATVAAVDPGRLLQAVGNLITNAAKFSPPDSPVDVSVRQEDSIVTVTVRDHGPGVPPERRPELFRRFSRLGSTATGMGLGLYLARLVVEAHGGVIRYEDAPGGGASFNIRLPRRSTPRGAGAPRAVTNATGPGPDPVAQSRRRDVLCVEDDASTAALIQRTLADHSVQVVSNGADALARARQQPPDVMLLDRHVAGLHGDDLLRELRDDARTRAIPIVVLTASASSGLEGELLAAGADLVLWKPFGLDDLRRVVATARRTPNGPPPPVSPNTAERANGDTAVLDPELTAAIEDLGREHGDLQDVVRTAIDDAHAQLVLLCDAVTVRDASAIARHAHAVRGALGNLGATAVIDRCAQMEDLADSGDPTTLREALSELRLAVRAAELALLDRFPRRS